MKQMQVTLSLLLLVVSAAVNNVVLAEDIGRLFLTPDQRARLQQLRHATPAADAVLEVIEDTPPAPVADDAMAVGEAVQSLTINGIVTRSDGTATVWVNGVNTYDGDLDALAARVDTDTAARGRVNVQWPGSDRVVPLKPGQSYYPATDQVSDLYEDTPIAGQR